MSLKLPKLIRNTSCLQGNFFKDIRNVNVFFKGKESDFFPLKLATSKWEKMKE